MPIYKASPSFTADPQRRSSVAAAAPTTTDALSDIDPLFTGQLSGGSRQVVNGLAALLDELIANGTDGSNAA